MKRSPIKRRRRGLGSTEQEHRVQLHKHLAWLKEATDSVGYFLREGDCYGAHHLLLNATVYWGNVHTHHDAVGAPIMSDAHLDSVAAAARAVNLVADNFETQCVRRRALPTVGDDDDPATKRFKLIELDGGRRRRKRRI